MLQDSLTRENKKKTLFKMKKCCYINHTAILINFKQNTTSRQSDVTRQD